MKQQRVPEGVRAGGQYTTTARGEPDVALFDLSPTGKMVEPATQLRSLGFNDEQTQCGQCGRTELRGTVIIGDHDGVEVMRVGTTCASKVLGSTVTRAGARTQEQVRRSQVVPELKLAQEQLDGGAPAAALSTLRMVRRMGLHRRDELELAARTQGSAEQELAKKDKRWGYFAPRAGQVFEVDSLEEALTVVRRSISGGLHVVTIGEQGYWVDPVAHMTG